jgi:membrane dipeptidase
MFRAIRDHGGTVGLNLFTEFLGEGEVTIETALRHIDHFLDLGGEKTLAIGGDLDGCESLPTGIAGIQDIRKLREALECRGYEEELLDDIFYGNLMRVLPVQDL